VKQRHEIRTFDYVNHPYPAVRQVLADDALGVFQAATRSASSRAETVAAALRVDVAGLHVSTDIVVSLGAIREEEGASPVTRIPIHWQAAQRPGLFPVMDAELAIYPLTATETQLDFRGKYEPPLSVLGDAVNAIVGHRLAEASVHRFVAEVAQYLRKHVI
jgi:hypothetical protein